MRKIDLWGLTHLYVVGGNGGNAAANAINKELESAGVVCSVIGIPKSIDNDILLVSACLSDLCHCCTALRMQYTAACCVFETHQAAATITA